MDMNNELKGVGRVITLGLAEYGATIYITGRNTEE
jgi:hypothetical protein